MGNLVAAGLLYPCSMTPNEKWTAKLDALTSGQAKFVIDGVNIGKVSKEELAYEKAFELLEEEELEFVKRVRDHIEYFFDVREKK